MIIELEECQFIWDKFGHKFGNFMAQVVRRWCGRYGVHIPTRSNLTHVANGSPPLQPWKRDEPWRKPRGCWHASKSGIAYSWVVTAEVSVMKIWFFLHIIDLIFSVDITYSSAVVLFVFSWKKLVIIHRIIANWHELLKKGFISPENW